jgi:MFS transporter, OPA family, glycerol-3-phosphate transporter
MPIHRGRARIFVLTWLCYAGYYLCRKNLAVVLPLLTTQEHFAEQELAGVVSLYSLFYAVCQFVTGPLSDRFGPRLVVITGLSLVVISNFLMGFAFNVWHLFLLACANGAGQATGWSALVKCMAAWWSPRGRGVVMAWWSTNYVLGGFVATAFATYAVTNSLFLPQLSWRRGFLFPTIVLLAILILFSCGVQNSPPATVSEVVPTRERAPWREMMSLFRRPTLWIISGSYFFLELTRYAFLFWLPFLLSKRFAYGAETSGYLSSLYDLVGLAGVLLAGYLSDRIFQGRHLVVSAIMLAAFAVTLALPSIFASFNIWSVGVWIGLCGLLTYGPDTVLSGAAAQDLGSLRLAGSAAGFIDGMGHLGSILSPFVVVAISQRAGLNQLFLFLAACAAVAGLILTFSPRSAMVVNPVFGELGVQEK